MRGVVNVEKQCQVCGYMKSVEEFRKNKQCKDGYHHTCKECYLGSSKKIKRRPTKYKYCPSCNVTRHMLDFYKDKYSFDGRTSTCKYCSRVQKKVA